MSPFFLILIISLFIALSALFILNVMGKHFKTLNENNIIALLESKERSLPITKNTYLYLDEKKNIYLYLNNEILDKGEVVDFKYKSYFSFNKTWEREIIKAVNHEMNKKDNESKNVMKEKKARFKEEKRIDKS